MNLEAWLALLEERHPVDIELGLGRCGAVYQKMGSPRPASKVFTIAGTNGKGSTAAILEAVLEAHGVTYDDFTALYNTYTGAADMLFISFCIRQLDMQLVFIHIGFS